MRSAHLLCAALSWPLLAAHALAAPPLPPEHLTIERLPPPSRHWVYVYDEVFDNEIDARVYLYDGDSHRRLGQISAGFYTSVSLSPDGATTAVAATYFARGSHGARTDVVEFTDNTTLTVTHEIVVPGKRAEAGPSLFNLAYSVDGHFLYAAYMTPAASFGVLDPAAGTVLGEIDTAGCVLVIPSGRYRVSSLCESGRLLTVTLDAQGRELARTMSDPFFNADIDPVFVQGIPTNRGYLFLSFLGEVHDIDFSAEQPAFAAAWSLLGPAEKGHWRPGAYQVGAIHKELGRLYVPMHEGGEGTHKDGGTEIWVYDLATHRRLARWPVKVQGLSRTIAVQVSQDPAPILFAATESGDLAVFDALTGRLRHIDKHAAQSPWMLLNP
ncbi:MAG TPA: amine dehydrogenase large subunit [Steroidobacteraceae bacterium]|jgi:methylamine dehydrogenase heavy chain|nr:amine dehydrogenase large subunit [Steroidobacteraceae bacterium]